jgi:predicted DNA binding CopG/RHH family protein
MPKRPEFQTEQEEAEFWDTHSAADFFDETTPVDMQFVDARPRKTLISLRLQPETIADLKQIAHARGIGYQTLIRMWIMERLAQEAAPRSPAPARKQAG